MYHLIATRTVINTAKNMKEYNEAPRPPVVIYMGTRTECYLCCLSDNAGNDPKRMNCTLQESVNLPILVNEDWTYWIV